MVTADVGQDAFHAAGAGPFDVADVGGDAPTRDPQLPVPTGNSHLSGSVLLWLRFPPPSRAIWPSTPRRYSVSSA
jgi:hypothetical protein